MRPGHRYPPLKMDSRGLRALIIGDLHYDAKNLKGHAALATLIHCALDAVLAPGEKLDLIVTLGDELEHHNPPPDVRGACVTFLRSLAARADHLIVLVGNHTRKYNSVSTGPDHTLADLAHEAQPAPGEPTPPGVHLVEDPSVFSIKGITFGALPYIDPPAFDEVLAKFNYPLHDDAESPLAFVLGHQEVCGSRLQREQISSCSAHWRKHWPPLISGHLHERHHVGNVLYVGTPMQHSLNESQDKYFYLATLKAPATPGAWELSPTPPAPLTFCPGYSSPCGELRQFKVAGVPIRHRHAISAEELPDVYRFVVGHPEDYHTIALTYRAQAQLSASNEYAVLAQTPRVRIETRLLSRDAEPLACPPGGAAGDVVPFSVHLIEAARPHPDIFGLLASIMGTR